MKEVEELIIGTRYWLDGFKEVSGVCITNECPFLFKDIEGDTKIYEADEDGYVGFLLKNGFYEVAKETAN